MGYEILQILWDKPLCCPGAGPDAVAVAESAAATGFVEEDGRKDGYDELRTLYRELHVLH